MMNKQNPKLQALITKLREIFQIDRPELDFGIYRILNARATEIADYLENRLPEKVQVALAEGTTASAEHLRDELQKAEESANALGVSPDGVPKVQELRSRLKEATAGASEYENAVFSHLLTFFSRYYDDGDFISQRRYKGDTYAIPYAGEEVMLYWANKDQYYTKSGENFSNYSFKLADGRTVHFRLVAADTAKDNRKDNDKDRRFAIIQKSTVTRLDDDGEEYEEELLPVEEVEGSTGQELIIRFEYKPVAKGVKQDALVQKAVETVLADSTVKTRWLDLGNRAPTEKNPQRTLLEKHLADYTTKNTADYFIHKDLGGFLKRELDFYIKNEVLHLDDVQNAGAFSDIEKNLRMIQCLRSIALELIGFLAQIENFQKKLWLKKKFVVSSHYCVTLDRVPEEFYAEIVANEKQWAQWFDLGIRRDSLAGNSADLKEAQFMMVDTSLFDDSFSVRLKSSIVGLDDKVDALLVHADSFQAALMLKKTLCGKLKNIYIDPPYNTGDDGFPYKDSYPHASWMTMIDNRVRIFVSLLSADGIFSSSIDRDENRNYLPLLFSIFGEHNFLEEIVWKKAYGGGAKTKHINNLHEYIHLFAANKEQLPYLDLPPDPDAVKYYKLVDAKVGTRGKYRLQPLNTNSNDFRKDLTYPIPTPKLDVFGTPAWTEQMNRIQGLLQAGELTLGGSYERGWCLTYASGTDWDGEYFRPERQWQWSWEKLRGALASDEIVVTQSEGSYSASYKQYRFGEDGKERGRKPSSVQIGPYTQSGTDAVRDLFGFDAIKFPKPVGLIEDIVGIGHTDKAAYIADFFAGSGTTGEAVIALNRSDEGKRKFVLADQSDYFDSVLKPRVQKVVYSAEWKDGKAKSPKTGISYAFKVIELESYEDTLNNLEPRRTSTQGDLLASLPMEAREDYLLHYMLDVESRGSLLSVHDFRKPFDYEMNISVDSAGAYERRKVDLVETFNYLIGLHVKHIDANLAEGYVRVEGTLPSGESALVLWRDCDKIGYETLAKYANRFDLEGANNPFSVIYINGDHNLPMSYTPAEGEDGSGWTRRIQQIEPVFLERMFAGEEM